ncbi:MAG: MBL fold metallo-hydrolase [Chlamydiae bacterium]|nr:MBL fold metallo-hydrolase [Chlamydiota bacterium]MBI3266355.1 MBL fold metallo-hydrolase [Chlamydiota bacterium]
MKHLEIGKFDIQVVSDGNFLLDGGTMFGMLPRAIWSKFITVDQNNMFPWATHCLLVSDGKKKILIETGVGSKLNEKKRQIYGRSSENKFQKNLKLLGVSFDEIDYVVTTHLHMDHCGGFTDEENEKLKPRFPKAKYLIQKKEWNAATHPNRLTRGTYWVENFLPVFKAGQVEWLEGDAEIFPGIKVFLTGAHSEGHQVIQISSQGKTLFCPGDLIPSHWHLRQTCVCAYDLSPVGVMQEKTRWLERVMKENWILHSYHDVEMVFGRVSLEREDFVAKPLE